MKLVKFIMVLSMFVSSTVFSQPIRYIVPYPPGGGTDKIGRVIAEALRQTTGRTVVVENIPGASTNIAISNLLRSPADGSVILQAENSSLLFNEHVFEKLPYNPNTDFTYIARLGSLPLILVTRPDMDAQSMRSLLNNVKQKKNSSYASPGIGSPHHIAMEIFKQKTKIDTLHVPYKGGAAAVQGLMSGDTDLMFLDFTPAIPLIQSGKVKPFAITSVTRSTLFPDIPTFTELGLKEVNTDGYLGFIGPPNMDVATVNKLNDELNRAIAMPEVQHTLRDMGLVIQPSSPNEFFIDSRKKSNSVKSVIKRANIVLN